MAAGTQKPARLHNNKCYVFQCNLNKLLQDASKVPPSKVACRKCTSRQRPCVCDAINGNVGKTPTYDIEQLLHAKASLTEIRNALDNVDIEKWSVHTKLLDTTSLVAKHVSEITTLVNGRKELGVEMVTNGWLKLNEMLQVFNIIDLVKPNLATQGGTLYSFHISECPGAFIAALNHNIKLKNNDAKLVWKATSLNPYNETNSHQQVLAEDILYRETWQQWLRGADETGNIIKSANIEYIWNHTSRTSSASNNRHGSSSKQQQPILVDVCTADGSFNCQADPNNQERTTAPLKFSELVCALGLIRIGGVFIIKLFSLLEEPSISIIAILSICFKSLKVYKPLLSKASSSEVYVICLDYCGITSVLLCALCKMVDEYARAHQPGATRPPPAIVPLAWLPEDFKCEYIDCATMFTQIQCRCLKQAMSQYKAVLDENALYKQKREFAEQYIVQFNIKSIDPDSKLVKYQSFSCQVPISGKDTSSLGHVAKRSFPDLQGRRHYDSIYKHIQQLRRSAFKENRKYYFCLDLGGDFINAADVLANGATTTITASSVGEPTDAVQDNVYKAIEFATLHKLDYAGIDLDGDVLASLDKNNKQFYASLLASLKAQEYISANWFTAADLKAHSFKSCHFCCNDLLFDIIRIRTHASSATRSAASSSYIKLAPATWQDDLITFGAFGEALSDVNSAPSNGAIHLAMVIKRLLNIGRYQYYLEITADASHEFPATCILKRHGIKGSLVYDFPSSQEPPYMNFESPQELKLVLDHLLGQGTVDKCLHVSYRQFLTRQNASYKDLVTGINDSLLKHSCDFIFCNPWTNSPGKASPAEVTAHELESQHLLVAQIIQALHCLNDGGDLVVATSTTLTRFTAGLLLVLSSGFEQVHLYTPETVAPWTLQSYIVCKGYTDRDKSTCRYFFQCLWDAISMHCKSGLAIISTVPPKYFTQISKLLYKYNVCRLLQQLDDLKVHFHCKSKAIRRQEFGLGRLLKRLDLVSILFPGCLTESQGPCKLLEVLEGEFMDAPREAKRSREDSTTSNGISDNVANDGFNDDGHASSADEDFYNEDSNSIWSQDDEEDDGEDGKTREIDNVTTSEDKTRD